MTTTAATPEGQERLREAANSVADSVARSGESVDIQAAISIRIWKSLFITGFPIHLLDDDNSRLVNPIVEAERANPESGGYAAGATPTTPNSTGGSEIANQTPTDYSRPVETLPAPGVMNQEAEEGGKTAKLIEDASQQLQEYIETFGKYKPPTVIGAVDPLTGKIATASSGVVPDVIAPELKAYAESLGGLGVKTACGNTLGRCAEFRAANELLLSNPSLKLDDINFTPAIRPRTGQVAPRCENCTNIFGAE